MSGPRRIALILGLLTLTYGILGWISESESAPLDAAMLSSALILILSSLHRPRTQLGRFAVVVALLMYCVCQSAVLVMTYQGGAPWSDLWKPILLLIGGIPALIWTFHRAKRRKLPPMKAYFRD